MLQGISLKKKVREKKREKRKTQGDQAASVSEAQKLYFLKGTFIPCLIHRGKWKMQGHTESAKTLQQFCPYRNQDFFCKPFPQMMLCPLSSGLGGLWTLYDPLLIKAAQPENLFSLKVFFLYISNLCQPQKMPNRVTFLTEQRCSELQERTNYLRSLMWLISRLLFGFSYIPTMLTNALPGAQWIRDTGT